MCSIFMLDTFMCIFALHSIALPKGCYAICCEEPVLCLLRDAHLHVVVVSHSCEAV